MTNMMENMKLIAHRGNVSGKCPESENKPSYIESAISQGYDVEIDVWFVNDKFMLGHDEPQYETSLSFLEEHQDKLWVHCKNLEALFALNKIKHLNVFFHDVDDATLTSHGHIWTYPNKPLMPNSVCVLPELGIDGDIEQCYGICSDYLTRYEHI